MSFCLSLSIYLYEYPPIQFIQVGQVSQLGRDVLVSFPEEKANIEERIADVQAMWEMLESRLDRTLI